MTYTDRDGDALWTPAELRRELGCSVRTLSLWRRVGTVPAPAEIRRRGYGGSIALWSAAQVAELLVRRRAEAAAIREAATARLAVARSRRRRGSGAP
jgi:hypothetical protein